MQMKNDEDREKYCNKLKIACEQVLCLGESVKKSRGEGKVKASLKQQEGMLTGWRQASDRHHRGV